MDRCASPGTTSKMAKEQVSPICPRQRMVIRCEAPTCDHAVVMDPRPIFGSRRHWPVAGRSERFRCRGGGRVAAVSYTRNDCLPEGPVSRQVISLWA